MDNPDILSTILTHFDSRSAYLNFKETCHLFRETTRNYFRSGVNVYETLCRISPGFQTTKQSEMDLRILYLLIGSDYNMVIQELNIIKEGCRVHDLIREHIQYISIYSAVVTLLRVHFTKAASWLWHNVNRVNPFSHSWLKMVKIIAKSDVWCIDAVSFAYDTSTEYSFCINGLIRGRLDIYQSLIKVVGPGSRALAEAFAKTPLLDLFRTVNTRDFKIGCFNIKQFQERLYVCLVRNDNLEKLSILVEDSDGYYQKRKHSWILQALRSAKSTSRCLPYLVKSFRPSTQRHIDTMRKQLIQIGAPRDLINYPFIIC